MCVIFYHLLSQLCRCVSVAACLTACLTVCNKICSGRDPVYAQIVHDLQAELVAQMERFEDPILNSDDHKQGDFIYKTRVNKVDVHAGMVEHRETRYTDT